MAPPFSVGRILTKPLNFITRRNFAVNDDAAEVIHVRPRRSGDEKIAEPSEESSGIVIFQDIGGIEACRFTGEFVDARVRALGHRAMGRQQSRVRQLADQLERLQIVP